MNTRLATLTLALLIGCSSSRTQLVVVVGTDFLLPDEANELEIEIRNPDNDAPATSTVFGVVDSESEVVDTPDGSALAVMPLSFGVTPSTSNDESVVVSVSIRRSSAPDGLVTQTFRTRFVPNQRTVLRMFLWRSCQLVECDEGLTCQDGSCVAQDVPPVELDCEGEGCELGDAGVSDAGMDGAGMDSSMDSSIDAATGELAIESGEQAVVEGTLFTSNAPAIVVDSTGAPHIAHMPQSGVTRVASLVDGSFSFDGIGTFESENRYHMAIDSGDTFHVVYGTGTTLTSQARRSPRAVSGGAFGVRAVGNGISADIAITPTDQIFTTVRREKVGGTFDLAIVPMAEESGDPRAGFLVEDARDVGVGATAADDSTIHVLYPDMAAGGLFYKQSSDASSWGVAEVVSPDLPSGGFENIHDLVIDSSGEPHAVYYDSRVGGVMVATRDGGTWTATEVGDGTSFVALDIDDADLLHLVSFDARANRLIYYRVAAGSPGPWPAQHIGPEVLGDASRAALAVEDSGVAHVAWIEASKLGYLRLDPR